MKVLSGRRHIAVVGGGVIGCAVAYELARAGFQVSVFERDSVAAHASGRNAGNLNPLHGTPKALIPVALEAYRIHGEVRAELELLGTASYRTLPVQRVHLGYNEADRPHLEETAELCNATQGFSAQWLNGDALHRIEPRLAADALFAVVTTGGLTVDSYEFTRSLAAGAERIGATIVPQAVLGLGTTGQRVTGVRASKGLFHCDAVVLATGPWVTETRDWLGISIDIEPVKGELLLLATPERPLRCDFTWGSACLYRRRENEVWVGSTQARCGFDCAPTPEARATLLEGAIRIMPFIRQAPLIDHIAALRPVTPTLQPIASRAEGWDNVYIANGGGFKGLLLCVAMARKIRCLLEDEGR